MKRLIVILILFFFSLASLPSISAQDSAQRPPIDADNIDQLTPFQVLSSPNLTWPIALSPDGSQVAASTTANDILLWDTVSGKNLQTFSGHTDKVYYLQFSPDAKTLLSFSADSSVRVWDLSTGQQRYQIEAQSGQFSPDGQTVATTGADSKTHVFDAESGAEGHAFAGSFLALSTDGKLLLTKLGEDETHLWDISSSQELHSVKQALLQSGTFSTDGRLLATWGNDGTIQIWETSSGKIVQTLKQPANPRWVSFSPDAKLLVSNAEDSRARVWDVATGKLGITVESDWATFSHDGTLLLGSVAGQLDFWRPSQDDLLFSIPQDGIITWAFSENDTVLAQLSQNSTIELLAIPSHQDAESSVTSEPESQSGVHSGHWQSSNAGISFDLTSAGEIVNFRANLPFAQNKTCSVTLPKTSAKIGPDQSFKFDVNAADGDQLFSGSFAGALVDDSAIRGKYTISMCGNTVSFVDSDIAWSAHPLGE